MDNRSSWNLTLSQSPTVMDACAVVWHHSTRCHCALYWKKHVYSIARQSDPVCKTNASAIHNDDISTAILVIVPLSFFSSSSFLLSLAFTSHPTHTQAHTHWQSDSQLHYIYSLVELTLLTEMPLVCSFCFITGGPGEKSTHPDLMRPTWTPLLNLPSSLNKHHHLYWFSCFP